MSMLIATLMLIAERYASILLLPHVSSAHTTDNGVRGTNMHDPSIAHGTETEQKGNKQNLNRSMIRCVLLMRAIRVSRQVFVITFSLLSLVEPLYGMLFAKRRRFLPFYGANTVSDLLPSRCFHLYHSHFLVQ